MHATWMPETWTRLGQNVVIKLVDISKTRRDCLSCMILLVCPAHLCVRICVCVFVKCVIVRMQTQGRYTCMHACAQLVMSVCSQYNAQFNLNTIPVSIIIGVNCRRSVGNIIVIRDISVDVCRKALQWKPTLPQEHVTIAFRSRPSVLEIMEMRMPEM